MGTTRADLLRLAVATGHPSTFQRELPLLDPVRGGAESGPPTDGDSSVLPLLAVLERRREAAVVARDAAEATLRLLERRVRRGDPEARAMLPVARDRWTAACDRLEAATDRWRAAEYLHGTYRDGLTGALQRDVGEQHLQQELDRGRREVTPVVVAFLDVDGLKHINDTRGHLAGDEALRAVGAAVVGCLRSYDVVVRFGGDEFVCALSGLTLPEAQARFAEVTRTLDETCPGTAVSVGLALAAPGDALVDVLRRADADLYARRAGRRGRAARPAGPFRPRPVPRPRPTGASG